MPLSGSENDNFAVAPLLPPAFLGAESMS